MLLCASSHGNTTNIFSKMSKKAQESGFRPNSYLHDLSVCALGQVSLLKLSFWIYTNGDKYYLPWFLFCRLNKTNMVSDT